MQIEQWSREELLRWLTHAINASKKSEGSVVSGLVPLCQEVTRRQLPVRIDCETVCDDRCHQCRRTLVIDDMAVVEWADHFHLDATAPGQASWALQVSSACPLPSVAAEALGIAEACADPAACLEGRD